jgi:hypothetical protein
MRAILSVLFGCLASGLAMGERADPPGQVGSVSYTRGEVLIRSPQEGFAQRVARNWPVTSGDEILTAGEARAELRLGLATARLDRDAAVTILELDGARLLLSLSAGTANLRVSELRAREAVDVKVRRWTVRLTSGDYRIDVHESGGMTLHVRDGEARIDAGAASVQQFAGEMATVAADATVVIQRSVSTDAFDRWTQARERENSGQLGRPHVARGLVGYEDLEAHGDWHWEEAYGMVWSPRQVPRGWTPYRFGRWILKAPWGWTWVDESPWGFAPFHYGRWVRLREKWHWLPGPRKISPVYAPALVKWLEDPNQRDVVGWSPLGPYVPFKPHYPASEMHARAINLFARPSSNPGSTDAGGDDPDAITWMARSAFVEQSALSQQGRLPPTAPRAATARSASSGDGRNRPLWRGAYRLPAPTPSTR